MAERPTADPAKLLVHWMEWEKGDTNPGELVKQLKKGGLREILEEQAAAGQATDTASA
ncbi:MAG TPA: hypothetical protein VFB78_07945 [Acidimicrobiales bacterium]|nr:hypothetical protein [Acidimicrobiales bacterium]